MEIITKENLRPNLQNYLSLISEDKLFYKKYGMKHPSGLYNVSLGKIENSIEEFFKFFNKYDENDFESNDKKHLADLLKSYRNILYSFREHLDDCFSIIKIFIKPPQKEKIDRNQYNWLKINAQDQVSEFFEEIREYKKYLDSIVNELKHNNAILCGIAFYDEHDPSKHCLGYFVANVEDEVYSPVSKIHEKFHDVYTGFSFRRDLHYNLFQIYKTSENIMSFLKNKIGIDFSEMIPKNETPNDNRRKIFQNLMDMPRYHFPDEYLKEVPSLALLKKDTLKLNYPSKLTIYPNQLNRIVLTHTGDGHTAKFRVPYMRQ